MTTEQLAGYEPRGPQRGRYAWAALGVAAATVVAWSLISGGQNVPAPRPSPTPSQQESPPTVIATRQSPLQLDEICDPVTDGRSVLEVSFTLLNASDEAADLRYVRPVLPMGALDPQKTEVALGHCWDDVNSRDLSHLVAPGESVHITFTLALPPDCPQPYPVAAEVTVKPGSSSADRRYGVGLYPDLGTVDFATCD